MTISYTLNIPASSHNPSTDQPNMLTNNNNIASIIAIDHSGFGAGNSGTHNHVTFTSAQTDPALLAGQTQIYPKSFGMATTYLETYSAFTPSAGFQVNGYSPLVKCMGRFTTVNGGYPATLAVPNNTLYVNIASIVQSTNLTAGDTVTVTFSNALPYNTYFLFPDVSAFNFGLVTVTKNTTSVVLRATSFNVATTMGIMVI